MCHSKPAAHRHLVDQTQASVARQQVVERVQVGLAPRQVVARQHEQLLEGLRAKAFAAQRPTNHALERERGFEQPLLVAADHALGHVVAKLFELAGQARLAARAKGAGIPGVLALAQLAQACADTALDRRPAGHLYFVSIAHGGVCGIPGRSIAGVTCGELCA